MTANDGVALVFPAYNAQRTLEATLAEIPDGFGQYRILVDDCSSDDTAVLGE